MLPQETFEILYAKLCMLTCIECEHVQRNCSMGARWGWSRGAMNPNNLEKPLDPQDHDFFPAPIFFNALPMSCSCFLSFTVSVSDHTGTQCRERPTVLLKVNKKLSCRLEAARSHAIAAVCLSFVCSASRITRTH